ncbi:MAG: L,D-transpeptidase family protein [Candidatus Omnitrophica bacterium]|nr:L,D-transpeptidase family protein [Candidatus Omnitrophota bacterium]
MRRVVLIAIPVILIIAGVAVALNIKKLNLSGFLQAKGASGKPSVSSLFVQAKDFELKGRLLEAKGIYQKLISESPDSRDIMSWQKKLEDLNIKLLFSPIITPKSALYEIKPGDTIIKIAREFKTTPELIMRSNNLSSDKIVPGKKIKVWTAPFAIFVKKSQNILLLKTTDEEIIKTYTVSTGANNSTPVGTFKIINKLTNPTWFKAGVVVAADSPENVLGTRWLGINVPGYGIHGTTAPEQLGQQVTQGCVRMANPEVEELYTIVPVDTEVTIVD